MKQGMDSEASAMRIFVTLKLHSLNIIFNFYCKLSFCKTIFPVSSLSTLCVRGGKWIVDSWVIIFHLCRIIAIDDSSGSP